MKDEIKEILNDLKNYANEGGEHTLMEYEIKHIQCYITNLQTIEQQYSTILSENAELENKITNLQEEINHLKQNKERTLEYIENNRIREKCIVDINTLEGLLNE